MLKLFEASRDMIEIFRAALSVEHLTKWTSQQRHANLEAITYIVCLTRCLCQSATNNLILSRSKLINKHVEFCFNEHLKILGRLFELGGWDSKSGKTDVDCINPLYPALTAAFSLQWFIRPTDHLQAGSGSRRLTRIAGTDVV